MLMVQKNILITGAAKRIGAACAKLLHHQGCNLILHYKSSKQQASQLCQQFNKQRTDSARIIHADLLDLTALQQLAIQATAIWDGVDGLVNNAALFYPKPIQNISEHHWDELMGSNLKAPFFLSQALQTTLTKRQGCIVNILDIHAQQGLKDYAVYSIAKAGLAAMTRILANELAPKIRVNGISPGAILWPEAALSSETKTTIIDKIPLKRVGEPEDIAKTVAFLINNAPYITGQIIDVDGGRTLFC
jgi:pteridine reductase